MVKLSDITPGMTLDVIVVKADEHGAVVSVANSLRGFIPPMHMGELSASDGRVRKSTLARFVKGGTVTARVIGVDDKSKRVYLTCKKTLVGSKLPVIGALEVGSAGGGGVRGVCVCGVYMFYTWCCVYCICVASNSANSESICQHSQPTPFPSRTLDHRSPPTPTLTPHRTPNQACAPMGGSLGYCNTAHSSPSTTTYGASYTSLSWGWRLDKRRRMCIG